MGDQRIGVLGGGQMGMGIARVFQKKKFSVIVYDIRPLSGDIPVTQRLHDLQNADIVIEAVQEDMRTKINLFQQCDACVQPAAIFLSNTSSLSLTQLARSTKRQGQFMGLHFMNPAEKMPLVELVHADTTTPETIEKVVQLCAKLEKVAVHVKDKPGFIVNRLLIPMLNEAIFALQEGVATREDIDQAMKLGAHHPMGPLALADFIGLDTCLAIMNTLQKGLKNSKYQPAKLLESYVQQGRLGCKSGSGFYEY